MELFKQQDFEVVVSPEALLLLPFKKLWDRDKHKDKRQAQKELAFIYFYTDFRSDFSDITDDEERAVDIKNSLGLKDKWVIDKDVQAAIDFYKERSTTVSSRLLAKMSKGIDKLTEQIDKIDFNERDKSGKPVHDPTKFANLIKVIPGTLDVLKETEQKVLKERAVDVGMKGNKEKNMYEDGI